MFFIVAARSCCPFMLPVVKEPNHSSQTTCTFVSFLSSPFFCLLLSWLFHFFTRIKILPTKEEIEMCTSYDGATTSLGKVEQFFVHLAKVPHCKLRAEAMLAKNNLVDQTDEVRLRLNYHEKASKQVRGSLNEQKGIFRKFLQKPNLFTHQEWTPAKFPSQMKGSTDKTTNDERRRRR